MLAAEKWVKKHSYYYMYTCSTQARRTFFYPTCTGYFYYEPGYTISRNSFDSYLIMHVKKGQCEVSYHSETIPVHENQIVILDCYQPHQYGTSTGWEAEWLHFDGPVARQYYDMIAAAHGNVFSLENSYRFEMELHRIYQIFHENKPVNEALISNYITTLLTEILVSRDNTASALHQTDAIQDIIAYINDHITEPLTLKELAQHVSLSPYYFTRLFKQKTGFTPHQYILTVRINHAKYLLRNTTAPVKEICFTTGFTSESSFCTTFRKWEGVTPGEYRGYCPDQDV